MNPSKDKIRNFFSPRILNSNAYHVPSAEGLIKLDAMENPYDWPETMVEAWLACLREVHPNRYPDPQPLSLKQSLRQYAQVPKEAEILLGNGSDEIIQILLMTLLGHSDATVLAPEPTFVMYRQLASMLGIQFAGVPLQTDFSLDPEKMMRAIQLHQPQLVFLAYPNNPTGNLFDADLIHELIDQAPGLVVIDEAYAPFAEASFMAQLENYDNLLVMRTLSKLGLAGLRLGFLAGPPAWLEQLDKLRLPYNINILTQLTAEFALAHADVFAKQTSQIRVDRERLSKQLQSLPMVEVYPSAANFLLMRVPDADDVFQQLKAQKILVKNLSPAGGLLKNCLRVTIGTPAENQAFLGSIKTIIRG